MKKKVLIVEDQFIEANDLQLMLGKAGYEVCGIARSVPIAQEIIKKENPGLVILDIFLKGKLTGIDLARQLKEDDIAFIFLSANSNEEVLSIAKTTEPYGFLVKPFREKDLLVTLEVAQYRHEHSSAAKHRREAQLVQQLENIVTDNAEWNEKILKAVTLIQRDIPFDFLSMGFDDTKRLSDIATGFLRTGFNEYQIVGVKELLTITGITKDELDKIQAGSDTKKITAIFNNVEFDNLAGSSPLKKLFKETFHVKSLLSFPLLLPGGELLSLCFYSRRPEAYNPEHISTFYHLQQTLARCIEQKPNAGAGDKISKKGSPVVNNNNINSTAPVFEGIIGNSHLLLNVFDNITQVAPFDTVVLIMGESGTGKERVADCIHHLSPRKNNPFVKVNCAALPSTLIESELFGHEKGAFTGALDKRIGKFEKADKGTIFLDEIGEMPIDLQVKLLRVLQEKYIERIGSRDITKVDVRIIAATNRKLEKEVAEGRFRLDLYYRLNVFPIELPPLRERAEDIPALAYHFIDYYNHKAGKRITGISDKVLRNMVGYHWPGNIRELENLIERSVLLTRGTTIEEIALPESQKRETSTGTRDSGMKTIHENERDYIIAVLKKCNGKVWGSGGAAEVLHVPPSTLKSKMKKLGIEKENIE